MDNFKFRRMLLQGCQRIADSLRQFDSTMMDVKVNEWGWATVRRKIKVGLGSDMEIELGLKKAQVRRATIVTYQSGDIITHTREIELRPFEMVPFAITDCVIDAGTGSLHTLHSLVVKGVGRLEAKASDLFYPTEGQTDGRISYIGSGADYSNEGELRGVDLIIVLGPLGLENREQLNRRFKKDGSLLDCSEKGLDTMGLFIPDAALIEDGFVRVTVGVKEVQNDDGFTHDVCFAQKIDLGEIFPDEEIRLMLM